MFPMNFLAPVLKAGEAVRLVPCQLHADGSIVVSSFAMLAGTNPPSLQSQPQGANLVVSAGPNQGPEIIGGVYLGAAGPELALTIIARRD